jgi:1-deoxy-D-xylulose-5-phosphate reductoisomerase
MRMKKVLILGSTGSIGTQALDVVARSAELQVVGLAADSGWELTVAQAREHGVPAIALVDESAAALARAGWSGRVLSGEEGVRELIASSGADLVLNAVVGAAGLASTVVALSEGIDVALANKESLVVGGELVMALAEATGARLLPVDSEHSALHQLIAGQPPGSVERLTITASGGPFRGRSRAELADVTVDDALAHPTWAMGGKITIDSATLMNKGLELMEAHHLFGTPYERIDVVVHPQSLIHGLVQLADRAMLAHIGPRDMRVAISYALQGGQSVDLPLQPIDLVAVGELTFEPVDLDAFPALRLARETAMAGGTGPCVLNAANEVAVHAFLAGQIPFTGIAAVIEHVLEEMPAQPIGHFEGLFATDAEARRRSEGQVRGLAPA